MDAQSYHNAHVTVTAHPKPSMNTKEAAYYLGCSESKLNKLRCSGGGPVYVKIGSRVSYETSDLDAWKSERKRRSTSDMSGAHVA